MIIIKKPYIAFLVLVRYTWIVFGQGGKGKGKNTVPHDSENCYNNSLLITNNKIIKLYNLNLKYYR